MINGEAARIDGVMAVNIKGDITLDDAHELHRFLLGSLAGRESIRINLGDVDLLDLSALQLLCSACRSATFGGKGFEISGREGALERSIIRAGFDRVSGCKASPRDICLLAPSAGQPGLQLQLPTVCHRLCKSSPHGETVGTSTPTAGVHPSPPPNLEHYRVAFRPFGDMFSRAIDPLGILEELRGLGKSYSIVHLDRIPRLDAIDPDLCYTSWDVLLSTDRGRDAVFDVFLFVQDDAEIVVDGLDGMDGRNNVHRLVN